MFADNAQSYAVQAIEPQKHPALLSGYQRTYEAHVTHL